MEEAEVEVGLWDAEDIYRQNGGKAGQGCQAKSHSSDRLGSGMMGLFGGRGPRGKKCTRRQKLQTQV